MFFNLKKKMESMKDGNFHTIRKLFNKFLKFFIKNDP